ncbi:MAG: tetratricopeptide repeat protein [bacterium]|nr:tetratricopeptide repeat protein [bacterium]
MRIRNNRALSGAASLMRDALCASCVFLLALCGCRTHDGVAGTGTADPSAATFVGREVCAPCHVAEHEAWQGSHHDLAMQPADETTVLGDFDGANFTYHDVTSTFFRKDGKFFVNTDGPDGKLTEFEIAYTFGVEPLQQYLIEFPDGRLQALSVCWDARPAEEGGIGWFHLYPDENVDHRDELHWTGPQQNWNFMCSECHSTRVRKGYDAERDAYETTWFEIDVSCEACHGPGSRHVEWAERLERSGRGRADRSMGLVVRLKDDAYWIVDETTGLPQRSVPRVSDAEVQLCARCHSRRAQIDEDYVHGAPLMDTHRPALLTRALYHADGQIQDEVYVYGSFLQSKMYREGVTCGDCHDPHTLELYGTVDTVCAQCHSPETYFTREHHYHEPGSEGGRCIDCHMPKTNYMVVDPRGDHSFRVPQPELTLKTGTPNACTTCHTDRSVQWAVDELGKRKRGIERTHFAEAIDAGRRGAPGAHALLQSVAADPEQPGIARATALSLLRDRLGPASTEAIRQALDDEDPLVRLGALLAVESYDHESRIQLVGSLLADPIRSVRIEAARLLAPVLRTELLPAEQRPRLAAALDEYREAQALNADRAEAQLNLGRLQLDLGEPDAAEAAYQRAIDVNPSFIPAYVNLADLYRLQGREQAGEVALRRALELAPGSAEVQHALGLLLVRQKQLAGGLDYLRGAAQARPEEARYAYVYGVGLHSAGRTNEALSVLKAAHERHAGDMNLLVALATISRDARAIDDALGYARKLAAMAPNDPQIRRLLSEIEASR